MTETERRTSITPDGLVACADTGEPMAWNEHAKNYTHAGRCSYGRTHRHLELTIHAKVPCGMECDCMVYEQPGDPGIGAVESWVDDCAERKRLTDSELAAEYWRVSPCQFRAYTLPDGQRVEVSERSILERFATLPHAVDAEYQ
jgi:hypothetical protein